MKKDEIVCLECGKGFKSLKRHLRTHHGIEPADYRAKWGLDSSYPWWRPPMRNSARHSPARWASARIRGRARAAGRTAAGGPPSNDGGTGGNADILSVCRSIP